jgi:hypothetical protein
MVNKELWAEPRIADFGNGPVQHGSGLYARWNFIHSHVGNRKTRRAANGKARRAAWKARKR